MRERERMGSNSRQKGPSVSFQDSPHSEPADTLHPILLRSALGAVCYLCVQTELIVWRVTQIGRPPSIRASRP